MSDFIVPDWPIYFKELLITKDTKNNVGIVCLWTKKNHFKDLENYDTLGQLYSQDGINYLLKNLCANRHIRYLIVCGMDLSGTGKKIIDFFNGIDLELDKNISQNEIEKLKSNIKIIDMININDLTQIQEKINSLEKLDPYDNATIIPTSESISETFPIEDSSIIVREDLIANTWLKILKIILDFGITKEGDHGIKQREILNLITITNENLEDKYLPDFLELTEEGINKYSEQISTNKSFDGVHYTYGQRFFSQFKVDQIKEIINELKRKKESRRAYATTWDPNVDASNIQPPCVIGLQATIRNNKLYFTVYIRSNDMLKAWPLNAFGLRRLQTNICTELNVEIGSLTTISNSAHIYENDLNNAKKKVDKYYKLICAPDPRGNLVIDLENNKIKVTRLSPEGIKLKEYFGSTAKNIYEQLERDCCISQTHHAIYFGTELEKAELALKYDLEYIQDVDLKLKKIDKE